MHPNWCLDGFCPVISWRHKLNTRSGQPVLCLSSSKYSTYAAAAPLYPGPVGRPNVRNRYKFTSICMPCMLTRSISRDSSRVIYEICFWKSKQHRFIAAYYIDKWFLNDDSCRPIHCSSMVISVCIFRKTISVNSSVFFFSLGYFKDPFNSVCVCCLLCATFFLLFIHIFERTTHFFFFFLFWEGGGGRGGVLKCKWQTNPLVVCLH